MQLASDLSNDTRLQMAEWVGSHLEPGSTIYVDHMRYSPEFNDRKFKIIYAPRAVIHRDLDVGALRKQGVDYLVLSSLWFDRYFSQPRTDEVVQKKLLKLFRELPLKKEFSVASGTYGFHNPRLLLLEVKPEVQQIQLPESPPEESETSGETEKNPDEPKGNV